VARLQAQAATLPAQPTATLHGDLHLQNFLVTDNAVALIDLDDLATGSPWQDVGSFCAALYYRGLLSGQPAIENQAIVDHFCRVYAQQCPWRLDSAALHWYTASALLTERVFRTFTRLKNGRLALLPAVIALAEQLSK
jgi:aminoglycoside phosphotransferase (APT) family kinase protein